MALTIPSFLNPFDPSAPLFGAYAWISGVYLDLSNGSGRVVVNVHPSAQAAASAPPIAQVAVTLGEVLVPAVPAEGETPEVPAVAFPGLAELMGDPDFLTAFGTIQVMLEAALAGHPRLAGSAPA